MKLSNHSYSYQRGWGTIDLGGLTYRMWWGDTNRKSQNEDVGFGFYESTAQDIDWVHYLANSYLQVWAAGNERGAEGKSECDPARRSLDYPGRYQSGVDHNRDPRP